MVLCFPMSKSNSATIGLRFSTDASAVLQPPALRSTAVQTAKVDAQSNECPAFCTRTSQANSAAVLQIGTEGGFLPLPVKSNNNDRIRSDPNSPTFGKPAVQSAVGTGRARGHHHRLYSRPGRFQADPLQRCPGAIPSRGVPVNDYFTAIRTQGSIRGARKPRRALDRIPEPDAIRRRADRFNEFSGCHRRPQHAKAAAKSLVAGNPLPRDRSAFAEPCRGEPGSDPERDFDERGRLIQMLGTNVSNGTNSQGLISVSRTYESPSNRSR